MLLPESSGCYAAVFEKVTKGGKDFLKRIRMLGLKDLRI